VVRGIGSVGLINSRLLRSTVFRLALIYLCLLSAAVLILFTIVYWSTSSFTTRQIDATIEAEIRGLAEQYDQRGVSGLVRALDRRSTGAGANRGLYLLTDSRDQPLAGNLSRWPDVAPDPDGWITFPLEFPEAEGGGINFGRARVFNLRGGLSLLVGHDIRERTRIAALIGDSLTWIVVVILGLTLLGGLLMSRSVLRRVDAINRTSKEIMSGDLSQRIPVSRRGDEFDQLAENLNAMLDQIGRLLAAMKEVSDNIAHDLRSPLARLRSRLEVTLMEDPDGADYRQAIGQTIEEADGLLKTFNALLSIAQAEAGAARAGFAPVDLATLVADVAELYEPLAEDLGLALTIEVDQAETIRGDRNLLFQALINLVDNALKYSPPNGRVTLRLTSAAGQVALSVSDHGSGIPAESRARVKERFVRLESSRSTPGSGLGLSLVAAVAELHGGTLDLADNGPGLIARLVLPNPASNLSRS
jgi:signal transduction histidine kinase